VTAAVTDAQCCDVYNVALHTDEAINSPHCTLHRSLSSTFHKVLDDLPHPASQDWRWHQTFKVSRCPFSH